MPRFPNNTQRTTIIGKTGSGKTQFSAHVLSTQNFDKQPWIMVDYKKDELLNSIDRVREIGLHEKIPSLKQPGIYKIHPRPVDDDDAVEDYLRRVWEQENVGLFFDEGTLIPSNRAHARGGAFQNIQMQGRSKRLPCITVTQRPSGVSRASFSEADFFAVFYLNTDGDIKRVHEFLPKAAMKDLQQDYHCRWYDVGKNELVRFSPCPDADIIRGRINDRLAPRRRIF